MNTTVPVGPATIVGYLLTALAGGGAVLAAAEHELAGPGKWLAILSAITAVTTNLGRQLQARAPVEVLTERPQSALTPEAPQQV
jgi:hypothetical protein